MDIFITLLNTTGKSFVQFAASMLLQSSVLIVVLLLLDFILRRRVRAVFRYCIWMLILVKLVLPTTLSFPTGLGYWFGEKLPAIADVHPQSVTSIATESDIAAAMPTASLTWQGLLFLVWLAGVITMTLLLVKRLFLAKGLIAQSKNASGKIVDILQQCRKQMAVHRRILLRLSPVVASPSVCGLFRPTILIPQDLPAKLNSQHLKSILLHELAHIKRGDLWVSLFQTILQIVYVYSPLLWVANAMIRKVRERAVDEMVLVAMGEQAEDYPEILLNVSRLIFRRPALSLCSIGVGESKRTLERRIRHMLNRPVPKSSRLGIVGLIATAVIGAILLPMGCNSSEQAAFQTSGKVRSKTNTIVPGVRVGDYTFDMSKEDVLKSLGKPKAIFYGQERYTLNNLPRMYYMSYDDISFRILDDSVKEITSLSPFYKFTNGLGVGDSEREIKQAFGDDFRLRPGQWKDFLIYEDEGLMFEIHKSKRTVMEINVHSE